MLLESLGDIAAKSRILPLVQLHVQNSGGSGLSAVCENAFVDEDINWWYGYRQAKTHRFPSFAGRNNWGWPCGLRAPLTLPQEQIWDSWIGILFHDYYFGQPAESPCEGILCFFERGTMFWYNPEFSSNVSAPHYQRQLWMIPWLTRKDCIADLSSCLSLAKQNIDNFLIVPSTSDRKMASRG